MPENAIVKLKDGRWQYQVTTFEGERKTIKSRKNESKKDFRQRCEELDEKVKVVYYPETLDRLFEAWIKNHVIPKLSASEPRTIIPIYKQYVQPYLGRRPLSEIKKAEVYKCLTEAYKTIPKGASPSYIAKIRGTISRPYNWAISEMGLDLTNPCQGLRFSMPTKNNEPRRRRVILDEDWEVLQRLAQSSKYSPYYLTLYHTGLRPSEGLGLQAQDIQGSLLTVRRGVTVDGDSDLKTPESFRTVPLTPFMCEILQPLADKRRRETKEGWLFPAVLGEPNFEAVKSAFRRLIVKAEKETGRDFPYSLYDFRHTCASRMAERGMPSKSLQSILGHRDIHTTMTYYVSMTPGMMEEARSIMGGS